MFAVTVREKTRTYRDVNLSPLAFFWQGCAASYDILISVLY